MGSCAIKLVLVLSEDLYGGSYKVVRTRKVLKLFFQLEEEGFFLAMHEGQRFPKPQLIAGVIQISTALLQSELIAGPDYQPFISTLTPTLLTSFALFLLI